MGSVRGAEPNSDREARRVTHPDVAAFVAKLDQKSLKRNGAGWLGRCPAHDDGVQSLSVKEGDGGKLLLHCFAGCTFTDVLRAAGVERAVRRTAAPLALVPSPPGIVAEYDYTDASGAVLYQAVRYEPKGFSVRTPQPTGGWRPGLNGAARVLYRLPLVTEAAAEGRRVYVVEGEKDADRLAALGLVATTNQGGAAQPWLPQYTEALAGASAVVIPDNDKAGEDHALDIARALHSARPTRPQWCDAPRQRRATHDRAAAGRLPVGL